MAVAVPSLAQRLWPLVLFGWLVAAVRLALEFSAPDAAMYFGVYFLMPIAYLVVGWRRAWGPVRWTTMAGTLVLIAFLVWGLPNSISYTIGQFQGWEHGRFQPGERAAPIADTALEKVRLGLLQGFLTSLAGTVWSLITGTLLLWLPSRLRGGKLAAA